MRVTLMGSSFDPPHFAHAAMVATLIQLGLCDEVWLAPSPPRWDKTPLAPLHTRLLWAKLFAKHLSDLNFPTRVTEKEIAFGDYRGSYFFLSWLRQNHPDISFSLALGGDSFATIASWRDPTTGERNGQKLLREFSIFVFDRGIATPAELKGHPNVQHIDDFTLPAEFGLTALELKKLSSTELRNKLKDDSPRGWCFAEVEEAVLSQNPYQ